MSKIKVVHHSKTVGYSGTDRTAQIFSKYLAQGDKYEPFLVYREGDLSNERLDIAKQWIGEDHVVPYTWVPGRSGRIPPYWPEQDNFGDVIAKIDPQIMHMHRSGYAEFPVNKNYAPKAKWIETNIFGFNDVTKPRQIDFNIYISEFIKDTALKAGNKEGPVLYNPIEMPALDMTQANKLACRERLLRRFGMPDDAVIMGRVGRPDNFDPIALRAMKKAQAACPQLFYLIVNSCENWRNEVTNLRLENVHWLPPIIDDSELSAFYMGLDFYAHARSDGECCPCNIQEAMMHNLAVVSHYSAIYNGQPEIIESGGFCVPLGDSEGYAKILQQLTVSADVRDYFGREARRRAMRDFEASCVVAKLARIYDWILNEKN
jgi:glycosyltransferase involved in cell wall biosynthesis